MSSKFMLPFLDHVTSVEVLKNHQLCTNMSHHRPRMGRDIISLDILTVNNLGVLKKINEVTLPTSYPKEWYTNSLDLDQITSLAYYTELPVGGIKAKLINTPLKTPTFESVQKQRIEPKIVPNAVYIESFAVLPSYRNLGIGSKLLDFLVEETKKKFVHEIVCHVHVDNKSAIEWYLKKGFEKIDDVIDYYKEQGIDNPNAVILSLKV